jgi:hypothetical protein
MQTAPIEFSAVDRLFSWWHAIAAPRVPAGDVPLSTREFVRKGRFTSMVLLFEFLINIPSYFVSSDPHLIIPLTISMFMLCIGVVLNRRGKTVAAGVLVIATIEIGMCSWLLNFAFQPGGLTPLVLPLVADLMQPTLLAVSIFSPKVSLPLGAFNILFILSYFTFFPKTPEMAHYFSIAPVAFTIYYIPIDNLIFITLISALWVSSALQAMKRADQAEEVNKLAETLAAHQRVVLQEKQMLEESIQQIVAVHAQAANGDFNARVPLDQKNVLWSVAGSLNTLLARLQRWRQEAQQGQRTEQAIQLVLRDMQLAERAGTPFQIRRTGTALDPLIAEIARMHAVSLHGPNETPPYPGSTRSLGGTPWPTRAMQSDPGSSVQRDSHS